MATMTLELRGRKTSSIDFPESATPDLTRLQLTPTAIRQMKRGEPGRRWSPRLAPLCSTGSSDRSARRAGLADRRGRRRREGRGGVARLMLEQVSEVEGVIGLVGC